MLARGRLAKGLNGGLGTGAATALRSAPAVVVKWVNNMGAMAINLYAAWAGFLFGCLSGAIPGLFFYRSDWLGGYASWPRRMIRLAHIAFFGIGFLNLSLALTARSLGLQTGLQPSSALMIIGAVAMPAVCYLSAWKPVFRNFFFIPAGAVTVSIVLFIWRIIGS